MSLLKLLKKLPIDLGQKEMRYRTKSSRMALEFAGKGNGLSALDAGCANGFWSEELKKQGWNVTSIDKEREYSQAIEHNLNTDLPFQSETFDLVFSTAVIAYLNDPGHFIKEIRRVLKPGGRFVITTPNLGFWLNYPLKIMGSSLIKIADPNQKSFFNFTQIKKLFPRAQISGYFPYCLIKFKINKMAGLLSPVFIISGKKDLL